MWPPPANSADKMVPVTRLVAVAIDKDRGSQIALKWATDNLLIKGQTVILVHVRLKSGSGSPMSSPCNSLSLSLSLPYFEAFVFGAGPNHASEAGDEIGDDPQLKELFLPLRVLCTRKDVSFHIYMK